MKQSVEVSAQDIKDALQRPSDFGLSPTHEHYDELFTTWSLGPVIRHRDSGLLEKSNADALEKHLREDHPELSDEWMITGCNHWAVGWVDHLSFHAMDEQGVPTPMFHVLKDWWAALEDYPVADEDDLSLREYEAAITAIEDQGRRYVKDGAPENWPAKVWSWLSEHEPSELERDGDQGAYPSEESVQAALNALELGETSEGDE